MIPEARGQAQRIVEDANGYREEVVARALGETDRFSRLLAEYRKAPEVTRERLYLETMQDLLGNTSKVLITGEQGGNNLLYLPLDKMMEGRSAAAGSVAPSIQSGAAESVPRMNSDLQRDLRSRESR
ncbi:HflK protein [compost metagenome]